MPEFKRRSQSKSKGRWSDKSSGRGSNRGDSGHSGGFNRRDSGRSRGGDSGGFEGFNRRGPSRGRGSDRPEMTKVICATCNKECEVPFKPTSNKPVYCSECFKDSGSSRSRDHGSRDSGSKDYSAEFEEINQKLDNIMKALESTKKPAESKESTKKPVKSKKKPAKVSKTKKDSKATDE